MSEEPATKHRKRVRQACEPCRRKKGRCSGEKPICALCARLGQACTWADSSEDSYAVDIQRTPGPSADLETIQAGSTSSPRHRAVNFLEDKLDEVLVHVRSLAGIQDLSAANTRSAEVERLRPIELPSSEVVCKAAGLYLRYCHNQPIPLFVPHQFDTRLLTLDVELQLCVCVVALRFESDFLNAYAEETSSYIETARSLVMKKIVGASQVELSTIQALCLLCVADWNNGMAQRAGTYLAIATELARSSRMDLYARSPMQHASYEEHVRCIWSIVMLQYLCGGVGVFTTSINTNGLRYPPSSTSNQLALAVGQLPTNTDDASDLGVVAYAIQMTEAWCRVRQYVQHRGKQDINPPWSSHSMYAKIMFRQMELESQMPHKHRFKPSGFTEHDISVLSTNRQYWAPWLYLQLVYHAIVCTLNHPLLLSLHLRRFRVKQIPELFLQHIQDMLSTHTDWVVHLLEIAAEKQFTFSDPFLAQFVAIVGTIFLQQSFTTDADTGAARRTKYERCLRFVQNLGGYWLCALEKVCKICGSKNIANAHRPKNYRISRRS